MESSSAASRLRVILPSLVSSVAVDLGISGIYFRAMACVSLSVRTLGFQTASNSMGHSPFFNQLPLLTFFATVPQAFNPLTCQYLLFGIASGIISANIFIGEKLRSKGIWATVALWKTLVLSRMRIRVPPNSFCATLQPGLTTSIFQVRVSPLQHTVGGRAIR